MSWYCDVATWLDKPYVIQVFSDDGQEQDYFQERTCHITDNGPWGYPYVCSECDASFDADVNNGDFNYCPNCGAKVVSE